MLNVVTLLHVELSIRVDCRNKSFSSLSLLEVSIVGAIKEDIRSFDFDYVE